MFLRDRNHPTLGDLTDIDKKWAEIETRYTHWREVESAFDASAPSDRASDCSDEHGVMAYAAAGNFLMAAHDHHALLYRLVKEDLLTPFATWSPLRALFETSFIPLWILHSDDAEERKKRGLSMVLDEQRQHGVRLALHRKYLEPRVDAAGLVELDKTDKVYSDASKEFHRIAANYSMSMASTGASLTKTIQQSDTLPEDTKPLAEMVWRLASSLQHGDTAALFSTSKATPRKSSTLVEVEFEAESFLVAYGFALDLFMQAIGQMVVRSKVKAPHVPTPPPRPKVKRARKKEEGSGN